MKQATFDGLAFAAKKKQARREKFLAQMDAVVPWAALAAVIAPPYPKAGRAAYLFHAAVVRAVRSGQGRRPVRVESRRRFAGREPLDDALPDATTILNFRRLRETHQLTGRRMNVINDVLKDRGLRLKGGTMVDATILHARPSTKNRAVFGDKGDVGNPIQRGARRAGVYGAVALTASKPYPLTAANRRPNRRWSRTRSRMEPLFRVFQWPLGYTQVRYPGLAKNAAPVFTLIGLTNLYRVRRRLLA